MTITLTREEAHQVLDALDSKYIVNCGAWRVQRDAAIETLRARLAQPEPEQLGEVVPADEEQLKRIAKLVEPKPEPVAWMHSLTGGGWQVVPEKLYPTDQPLYTAPPQREWQGLTDEEAEQIIDAHWNDPSMFIEAIEAKLKEKNT